MHVATRMGDDRRIVYREDTRNTVENSPSRPADLVFCS